MLLRQRGHWNLTDCALWCVPAANPFSNPTRRSLIPGDSPLEGALPGQNAILATTNIFLAVPDAMLLTFINPNSPGSQPIRVVTGGGNRISHTDVRKDDAVERVLHLHRDFEESVVPEHDALQQVAAGGVIAGRTILTAAGNGAEDQPRIAPGQRVVTQSRAVHCAGTKVPDQHIHAVDQRRQRSIPSGCFRSMQMPRLPRCRPGRKCASPPEKGGPQARPLSPVPRLQLVDLRAGAGEHQRAVRSGESVGKIEHALTRHPSPRRAPRTTG
jgi:hypothetical protein